MATIEFPPGQVALVTDATGGIGTATVRRCAREAGGRGVTFEEITDKEWGAIPLEVAGEPSTIADAVVYLSSPSASSITGAPLDLNGGVLLH